jgi:predicted dehydrogenase
MHHRRDFLRGALTGAAALALSPEFLPAEARSSGAPLKLGLVGVGRQGRAMLAELQKFEAAAVVALADPLASRLESGLKRAKGAVGFASQAEMLEKSAGLDAVLIAAPTHLHKDLVLAALEAKKHVYVEAPLAHSPEDALAIAAAGKRALNVLQVGQVGRLDPIYLLANKFYKTGSIGDTVAMRAQWRKKTSWRTPAGSPEEQRLLDWKLDPAVSLGLIGEVGLHQLDVFHWFLGAYPTRVSGFGSIQLHQDGRELPDTVHCQFEFPGGKVLQYEASLANSFDSDFELISGTQGAIKLAWTRGWLFKEADAPTQGWEVYANRQSFANEQGITLIADATKLAAQDKLKDGVALEHPPLYYGLNAFLTSILEGRPAAVDASEGARAVAVAHAAQRAITSGASVSIGGPAFEEA